MEKIYIIPKKMNIIHWLWKVVLLSCSLVFLIYEFGISILVLNSEDIFFKLIAYLIIIIGLGSIYIAISDQKISIIDNKELKVTYPFNPLKKSILRKLNTLNFNIKKTESTEQNHFVILKQTITKEYNAIYIWWDDNGRIKSLQEIPVVDDLCIEFVELLFKESNFIEDSDE